MNMEEPKKKLRTSKDYWHSLNQIFSIFAVGLSMGVFGPTLMDLAETYGSESNDVALVNSTRALGTLIGSIIGGYFYKFINDQIIMFVTVLIYAVTTTLIPFFSTLWILHALGVVSGFAIGMFEIGSQVRLVKIWGKKSASALQAFHTAFGVGAMLAPFSAAPFLSVKDAEVVLKEAQLKIPYLMFAFVFLLIIISMVGAYIFDPTGIHGSKEDQAAAAAAAAATNKDNSRKKFERILVTLLFLYILFTVNSEITYSSLVSTFAFKSPQLKFSKSNAAYLAGVFWTTFTMGRVVSIFTAAYFNVPSLLFISHIFLVVASSIMIFFERAVVCAWVGTALLGLGLSSLFGAATGYTFQFFTVRHFHVSVIMVAGCVGVVLSSYFVPPAVEKWPLFLQWYTGAGNILHFFVLIAILWCTRGHKKLEHTDNVA